MSPTAREIAITDAMIEAGALALELDSEAWFFGYDRKARHEAARARAEACLHAALSAATAPAGVVEALRALVDTVEEYRIDHVGTSTSIAGHNWAPVRHAADKARTALAALPATETEK